MATKKQIEELSAALLKAKACAELYIDNKDEGTCNFDTPQVFLKGWRSEDVRTAFENAELRCDIQKNKNTLIVDIYGCLNGQGSRRTLMAEAVRDSLVRDGYEAYVYYQMD